MIVKDNKSLDLNGASRKRFFDEQAIERYVRYPDTLDAEIKQAIAQYVQEDTEARALSHFYRTYYEELDRLEDYVAPEVEAFIASLFPAPSVVALFPYLPSTQISIHPAHPRQKEDSLKTVAVLASQQADALVCVLKNQNDPHQYRLQVLTTDSKRRAYTVISFIREDLHVVINETGTASFTLPGKATEDFLDSSLLRFPFAELQIDVDELQQTIDGPPYRINVSGHRIDVSLVEENRVTLELLQTDHPPASPLAGIVPFSAHGEASYLPLEFTTHPQVTFDIPSQVFVLRFYE